jgi:pimeloyl-ACP methyl ester carboxylesterase
MLAFMSRFPVRSALAVALALAAIAVAAPLGFAQAPTSAPLRTASVNGAQLGYRVLHPQAKGTPLVMIAGYGVTMAEWDPAFVERLAQGRRVVLFDNRGIGNSTGAVKGLTIGTMADDTVALIKALHLRRPDVLGWSMGGYIAQRVALDAPKLVDRLVLASANPGSPKAVQPSAQTVAVLTSPSASATSLLPVLFPSDQQAAGNAWLAAISAQPDLTANDFATPGATMSEQAAAAGPRWYGRGDGTYDALPRIEARTLVAYGTEDVVVPPANAKLLLRRLPHATPMKVANAGHAFLFQSPAPRAAAFAHFLDGR